MKFANPSLTNPVDERPAELECLFFGNNEDGCQCALEISSVERVDPAPGDGSSELPLSLLGFSSALDDRTARVLRVTSGSEVIPLKLLGAVTTRSVPAAEMFSLPRRPFEISVFSALISSDEHGRALLLDPERLLKFYLIRLESSSSVNAQQL